MNMKLKMNHRHTRFFQIKDHNTQANLCKNIFYPESIKNDNGAVAMRIFCATVITPKTASNLKIMM